MQHYLLPRQDRHPRHVVQGGGGGPHIQPRHETRAGAVSYRALNDGARRLHKDFTITEKAPTKVCLIKNISRQTSLARQISRPTLLHVCYMSAHV